MNGFNSIGDLSRMAVLRQGNAGLKAKISVLSQEVTTGLKADVPAALGGRLTHLAQVADRLALLDTYDRNAAAMHAELTGAQAAMEAMGKVAVTRGAELATLISGSVSVPPDTQIARAEQDFRDVVGLMNTSVGGRFVFSGTAVTTSPLSSADDILAAVRAQVAGLSGPAEISGALDAWFASSDSTGFAATMSHGNGNDRSTGVAPDTTVGFGLSVRDPAFGGLLKGLAMAAIAGDAAIGLDNNRKTALLNEAGRTLVGASKDLTAAEAGIGMRQQLVEDAQTRNAAETTALSLARSEMLSADPFESASALSQAESNLQTLYALTARLSRLSLTDYL